MLAHTRAPRALTAWLAITALFAGMFIFAAPTAASATGDESWSIAGQISASDGELPADVGVQALGASGERVFGIVAEDGSYAISGLAPGDYHLRFTATGFAPRFYPDATRAANATLVSVWDADVDDINVALEFAGSISGFIGFDDETNYQSTFSSVVAFPADLVVDNPYAADEVYFSGPVIGGAYTIDGLPEGEYVVRSLWGCDCSSSAPFDPRYFPNSSAASEATPIMVRSGQARVDINISHPTPGSVSGVVSGGTNPWVELYRLRMSSDGEAWSMVSTLGVDGPFAFAPLAPGTYAVRFGADNETPRWWKAGSSQESADRIVLAAGESVTGIDVAYELPIASSVPLITGVPKVGELLTAVPGPWSVGAVLSYQWFAGKTAIKGATSSTYKLLNSDAGALFSVRVAGALDGYVSASEQSVATAVVTGGVLTAPTPTISGSVAVGFTLTAATGTWTAGTTLKYQWYAAGVAVSGAKSATFVPTTAQKDKQLSVRVTGSRVGHTSVAKTSALSAKVATTGTPSITGAAVVGTKLTAATGTWTASSSFTYQWYANGVAISRATTSTFTLTAAQASKAVTVKVTGKKTGYPTVSKTSRASLLVVAAGTPTVSGSAVIGSALKATTGSWTAGTGFTYKWYANGVLIAGAKASTFTPTTAQAGKALKVMVTGAQTGFATTSKSSAASLLVLKAGSPAVSGTAVVGYKLTAAAGAWTAGSAFAYQWYANGVAISRATASTFTLTSAQAGKALTVRVTAKKTGYPTVSKTSGPSLLVMSPGTPAVSGSAVVGSTLTAATGSWTRGTSLSIQWFANGSAISGASGSAFTPSLAYAGKTITVKVTGSQSGYASASKTSAGRVIAYPSRTTPTSSMNCPSWARIKGNQTTKKEWIYHVPGGQYYNKTAPEECFTTEAAAQQAGYRKSLR